MISFLVRPCYIYSLLENGVRDLSYRMAHGADKPCGHAKCGFNFILLRRLVRTDEFRKLLLVQGLVSAHESDEPMAHAHHIKAKVRPAMAVLRTAVDALENHVAADLWPLPTYRELLFLK